MKRFLPLVLLALIALLLAIAASLASKRNGERTTERDGDDPIEPAAAPVSASLTSAEAAPVVERTPLPANEVAATRRTSVPSSAPPDANGPSATLYGRVIVARERSPKGLSLFLRRGYETRARSVLGHDGKFEWTGLPAGEYQLSARGSADVIGGAVNCLLRLEPGAVREFDWDLSDRCPAVVSLNIAFDGVAARSTVQLRLGEAERARDSGERFVTNRSGTSRVRVTDIDHRTSDGVLGALGLHVSNVVRGSELPDIVCVGQPVALAMLRKGESTTCDVAIRTVLVRVLPPIVGELPPPNPSGVRSFAVGAESHRATPASSWHGGALVELELDAAQTPLATFRAGPGTYFLRTWPYERESQATFVVRGQESVVECRLVPR